MVSVIAYFLKFLLSSQNSMVIFNISVPGNKDEVLHIKHCKEDMDYRDSSRVFGRHEQSSSESLHVSYLPSQYCSFFFLVCVHASNCQ